MEMKQPQRGWWENILFVIVFVGMLAFILNSYVLEQKAYKQRALYYQLMLLRQGVNLFTIMEKRFPASLVELGAGSFKIEGNGVTHRYVDHFPITPDGKVVDPFGNAYKYDQKLGWVMSTTPGYEFW